MVAKPVALASLLLLPALLHATPRSYDSTRDPAFGSLRYDTRLSNALRCDVAAPPPVPELRLELDDSGPSSALRAAREALASIRARQESPTPPRESDCPAASSPSPSPRSARPSPVPDPRPEFCAAERAPGDGPARGETAPAVLTAPSPRPESHTAERAPGDGPARDETAPAVQAAPMADSLVLCLEKLLAESRRVGRLHPEVDAHELLARSLCLLGVPPDTPLTRLDEAAELARALRAHLSPTRLETLELLAAAMSTRG